MRERASETLQVHGTVTGPTAGQAIATLIAPPGGYYNLQVYVRYGTGGGAKPQSNMHLRRGAVVLVRLPLATLANAESPVFRFRMRLDGSQNVSVNAITAAPGDIHEALLIAERVALLSRP